jgi:hypothetical protein
MIGSPEHFHKLEKSLAFKLGLAAFKSGSQVIRNERGWREIFLDGNSRPFIFRERRDFFH